MYIFFVEQNFISSMDLLDIKDKHNDGADFVQCYSSTTLLSIVEKLKPDAIIVDFILIEKDFISFFRSLRSLSSKAYIMVLIERDDYDDLFVSIEQGVVDEYIVKPVNKDDFMARVHMVSRKKEIADKESDRELIDTGVEEEDSISFKFDHTETTDAVEEISDDTLFVAEPETEFDLDLFNDANAYQEVEDRFSKIFGDEISSSEKELIGSIDRSFDQNLELDTALARPAKEFLTKFGPASKSENDLGLQESGKQDFDHIFNVEQEKTAQVEQFPDEQFIRPQEVGLPQELPPEEDDHYKYQQYGSYRSNELRAGRRADRKKSTGSGFASLLSIIGNILLVLLLVIMAVVSFFYILSRVSESVPQVAGYQFYVIKSVTMSPEITDGSLVLGRETDPARIAAGDIITFFSKDEPGSITTGRVVEVGRENGLNLLTTRESISATDTRQVSADNVIGRVIGSVPYIGHLIDYAQTLEGLILVIFVPGILIIVFQMGKIIKYFTRNKNTVH